MDRCASCGKYDMNLDERGYCTCCRKDTAGQSEEAPAMLFSTVPQHPSNSEPPSVPTPEPEAPSIPPGVVGPGYRFTNRYVVVEELGQGGMGKVYLARDENLGRRIAVKVIRPQDPRLLEKTSQREEYAGAFLEEAKVGAELDHPNIAKVFDFGIDHGEPFTVFEFVEGETLSEVLKRRGALPLEEVRDVVGALAQGLAYAHAHHIVHRDLKPANVRVTPEGTVKILDLGLAARFREEADWRYCGTPTHVAPEQVAAQPCDGRTDQYALAVMAFQMVTGQLPFNDDNVAGLLMKHMKAAPPNPRKLMQGLPDGVAEAILRGLAKKPADRFDGCDEFAAAMGCTVVRKGGSSSQLLNVVRLARTSGTRLNASPRFTWIYNQKSLYLGLATDGLYVWCRDVVVRIGLDEVKQTKRSGKQLTLESTDGNPLQRFAFVREDSCADLNEKLEKLLAARPAGAALAPVPGEKIGSVVLFSQRVRFTHQTLGTVSHEAKKKTAARVGAQIAGQLLGADAVAEVQVQRLPTFFNSGYRCTGVAVRALDREGRLQLGAMCLEQRTAALAVWMFTSIFLLYATILVCLLFGLVGGPEERSARLHEYGYIFAAGVLPLLSVVALRTLRWPQLARPAAWVAITLLIGVPLWLLMNTIVFMWRIGVAADGNRWLLGAIPLVLTDPIAGIGLFTVLFLIRRNNRFAKEYRCLSELYPQEASWQRLLGEVLAWGVAVAFLVGMVGMNAVVIERNFQKINAPTQADIDRAKKADEAFNKGVACAQTQPEQAWYYFLEALETYRDLEKRFPSLPFSHVVARTHFNLGAIAMNLGPPFDADLHLREAIRRMEVLLRDRPHDQDSQQYRQMLAESSDKLKRVSEARVEEAIKPVAKGVAKKADEAFAKEEAEAALLVKTIFAKAADDPTSLADLEPLFAKALPLLDEIVAKRPENRTSNVGLFLLYTIRAAARVQQEKPQEADELLTKGQRYADFLEKASENDPAMRVMQASFKGARGWAWTRLGKQAEAERVLQQAEADFRELLKGPSPQVNGWLGLADCLVNQSDLHSRRSRWKMAEDCLRQALDCYDKFFAVKPNGLPPALSSRSRRSCATRCSPSVRTMPTPKSNWLPTSGRRSNPAWPCFT